MHHIGPLSFSDLSEGGGDFPRLREFGEKVRPFILHLRINFFFFFAEVEITSRALIALFSQGSVHSGSES